MAIILDADVIISGEKGTFDFHGWVASQPNEQFEGLELFNSNALEALDAAIVHQALYVTRQHK